MSNRESAASDVSFGAWVQQRRKALDLTQDELARRVGCSLSAIRKIESDERRPSRQIAELLAQHLRIAADQRELFLRVARAELRVDRLPPPALDSRPAPSNVPCPATPLVGREPELAALGKLLLDPQCRLLTLVGPGGMGKTRLAIEAAHTHRAAFADGVYLVSLAPLSAPEFIVPAIAGALGFSFYEPVDPKAQLLNYLCEKKTLLVLDNIEHLLIEDPPQGNGVELVAEVLQRAPQAKLLVTSRERLDLQGEWVFDLEGLPVPPESSHDIESYSAAALFVAAARRVRAGFALSEQNRAAVARICQLVEGMPLGIELAAAWVWVLSCWEIAQEIERSVSFLATTRRDVPERHRSLRAVFDHSWRLLSADEQRGLRQLSVFRGGFEREAAGPVAGTTLPLLSALASKSLLYRRDTGRCDLHELIRQYSAFKLSEAGEEAVTRQRHLDYYRDLAEAAELLLLGAEEVKWIERFEAEIDNVRAALAWGVEQDVAGALRLASALVRFWTLSRSSEGHAWTMKALEAAASSPAPVAPAVRAKALLIAAFLSPGFDRGLALVRESMSLAGEANDPRIIAYGNLLLAREKWLQGQLDQATTLYEESEALFRALGDKSGLVTALQEHSIFERYQGRYRATAVLQENCLALARETGSQVMMAEVTVSLAFLAIRTGDFQRAQSLLEEGAALRRAVRNQRDLAWTLASLARVAAFQGDYDRAESLLDEGEALCREIGDADSLARLNVLRGEVVYWRGDVERAAALSRAIEAALELKHSDHPLDRALTRLVLGNIARARGDDDRALARLTESLEASRAIRDPWHEARALHALGQLRRSQNEAGQAEALFNEALQVSQTIEDRYGLAQGLEGLASVAALTGKAARAAQLFAAASALRDAMEAPVPPIERADYEGSLAAARAQLDEADLTAAWRDGRSMTFEEAIAYAL
jgi:predicted ATPase/DNA-binding XRE family transcriptional regulator